METIKLEYGEGRTRVCLEASAVGKDWQVVLTAGKAHIGAVALAVPCPRTAEGVTASVSVLTAPGHRDDIPAGKLALKLCKATSTKVTVTAGLHLDGATLEEINDLVDNSVRIADILVLKLKGER